MKRRTRNVAFSAVAATAAIALGATSAYAAIPTDTSALEDAVTADGVMEHVEALQEIADANGGNRASGTPGYDASVSYIRNLLEPLGYVVSEQTFTFNSFSELSTPEFERISPDPEAYVAGEDFFTAEYSGSGDVTALLEAVDLVLPPGTSANTSTSGCEAADFTGFTAGNIALVQRGTCAFADKAANAAAAGASGVIIFNEGQDGRQEVLNATLGDAFSDDIPVVGTSFAIGEELATLLAGGEVSIRLKTDTLIELDVPTKNIIAETPTGRTDRVIVAGAHVDSISDGPGVNDNGAGAAAMLETAQQMAEQDITPRNAVRFAWWGAEESGLIGSQYYVDSLTRQEANDIELYLNFDMVGSPNYANFVYDGDGDAFGVKGPSGSDDIERLFSDFFASIGETSEPTEFDGRSDYDAFIAAGIPAGGLFTGAEGAKTADQVVDYGGLSEFLGEPVSYDPCYHATCDSLDPIGDGADAGLYEALNDAYGGALEWKGTITNINQKGLGDMADAIAHSVLTYAMTTSSVNGTGKASPKAAEKAGDRLGSHLFR